MRLLLFTTQFPPDVGGVETMSWQLARHIAAKDVMVSVLAPRIPGCDQFDAAQEIDIKRFDLGSANTALSKSNQKRNLVRLLNQQIIETQPDAILCTEWDPCAYIANLATRNRVPYFVIAHGMELLQLPRSFPARQLKSILRRRTFVNARRIFAVSNFTREHVVALGVRRENVSVIPNGVEIHNGISTGDRTNGSGKNLTTVSRLVPRKGHDVVLRAMPQILDRIPAVRYRVVGTGPQLDGLKNLASSLGVEESVEFCGEVSNAQRERMLSECDAFIFPTRETATDFEGLGIAVLEAMERGKAVIVTRAGGVPELVQDGHSGLVVEPDRPEALAEAVISLLEAPDIAREMGRNARSLVQEKYGWGLIADRYLDEIRSGLSIH